MRVNLLFIADNNPDTQTPSLHATSQNKRNNKTRKQNNDMLPMDVLQSSDPDTIRKYIPKA